MVELHREDSLDDATTPSVAGSRNRKSCLLDLNKCNTAFRCQYGLLEYAVMRLGLSPTMTAGRRMALQQIGGRIYVEPTAVT